MRNALRAVAREMRLDEVNWTDWRMWLAAIFIALFLSFDGVAR